MSFNVLYDKENEGLGGVNYVSLSLCRIKENLFVSLSKNLSLSNRLTVKA